MPSRTEHDLLERSEVLANVSQASREDAHRPAACRAETLQGKRDALIAKKQRIQNELSGLQASKVKKTSSLIRGRLSKSELTRKTITLEADTLERREVLCNELRQAEQELGEVKQQFRDLPKAVVESSWSAQRKKAAGEAGLQTVAKLTNIETLLQRIVDRLESK